MAYLSGHYGRLSLWSVHAQDAYAKVPFAISLGSNAYLTSWRMIADRPMRDVTPKGVGYSQWIPSVPTHRVVLRGFLDSTRPDENWNKGLLTLKLYRWTGDGNYLEMQGWFEHLEFNVDIGAAMLLQGTVRVSGPITEGGP